jgi:flagellar L-ring protein FlgH
MRRVGCIILVIVVAAASAVGKGKKDKDLTGVIQHESLGQYLTRMQTGIAPAAGPSYGSLWVDSGRLASLSSDYKALHAGDLITILVVQDTTANNAGSVSAARNFSASSGISALPGHISTSGVTNLFSPTSAQSLAGKGQAVTTSTIRTSLTGRVVAVLPGGNLVVEAERQLTLNNEKQVLLLRGLVRPGDVGANNSVTSNAIGDLEFELKGKGVISDGNRPPNVVTRILLKILGF